MHSADHLHRRHQSHAGADVADQWSAADIEFRHTWIVKTESQGTKDEKL